MWALLLVAVNLRTLRTGDSLIQIKKWSERFGFYVRMLYQLECLWRDSGKCNVYQCVICNEVVVACLKLMTLLPFILKFSDGVSNHIPAVERTKRISSCSRRPCSNSNSNSNGNSNGNKPAASWYFACLSAPSPRAVQAAAHCACKSKLHHRSLIVTKASPTK